jgi:hypothetical protein
MKTVEKPDLIECQKQYEFAVKQLQDLPEKYFFNAIVTPDGTILESKSTHDYQTHIDKFSGEEYMVDGGHDYLRRNCNKVPYTELSISNKSDFLLFREAFKWGSFGKNPKKNNPNHKLMINSLERLEDSHIISIIKMFDKYEAAKLSIAAMKAEQAYRQLVAARAQTKYGDHELLYVIKNDITLDDAHLRWEIAKRMGIIKKKINFAMFCEDLIKNNKIRIL